MLIGIHDPESRSLSTWNLDAANRNVGFLLHMLLEHQLVIHFVDVIARQHHEVFRGVTFDNVEVLIDRIRGALIPEPLRNALARGQNIKALVADGAHDIPGAMKMPDEAVRLVLGRDGDVPYARIESVRERKINDARFAAEIDGGLRAPRSQLHQTAAASPGQNISHGFACYWRYPGPPHRFLLFLHTVWKPRFA